MKYTLHPFYPDDTPSPLLSIAGEDGYNFIIDEEDVPTLIALLSRYQAGEHDGAIRHDDPRTHHCADDAMDNYLGIQNIAGLYGIHRQTVYDAIEYGYIPVREIDGRKFIRRADAEARWGKRK